MGVFRTKFVTENVEQTGVREGEAQKTTLPDFVDEILDFFFVSSVPDFLHDGSRQFRIFRFAQ